MDRNEQKVVGMVTTYECSECTAILPIDYGPKIERGDRSGLKCPKCGMSFASSSSQNPRPVGGERLRKLREGGWQG